MDKYWKKRERKIASLLGTRRTPLSGSSSQHTSSDTLHERLYVEIKCRKKLPKWFKDLLDDTMIKATKEAKVPLVVLHQKNSKDDYCVCWLSDFVALVNSLKETKNV